MAPFEWLLICLCAQLAQCLTIYNPLLTYTIRYRKLIFHPSFDGNYTINQYNQREYINGHIFMNTTKLIDRVTVIFNRCNPDSMDCEYFQTWTFLDICSKVNEKNQIWSNFYTSFEPPIVCPIDKINYRMRNATMNIDQAIVWYPEMINYHWKVTHTFYSGANRMVGGYTIEMFVFGYRKRMGNTRRSRSLAFEKLRVK